MQRILIIRHGEKATPDGMVGGVDDFGRASEHELSVLGWQRAGALAVLFAGADGSCPGLFEPRYLYAARPTADAPSVRAVRTLQPLADVLGLQISLEFAKGEEGQLVASILTLRECVLICWEHKAILDIARLLMGSSAKVPREWPEDRYDIVWAFERDQGSWQFMQVPELLLAGDRSALIE